jgi:hypothetical protein
MFEIFKNVKKIAYDFFKKFEHFWKHEKYFFLKPRIISNINYLTKIKKNQNQPLRTRENRHVPFSWAGPLRKIRGRDAPVHANVRELGAPSEETRVTSALFHDLAATLPHPNILLLCHASPKCCNPAILFSSHRRDASRRDAATPATLLP